MKQKIKEMIIESGGEIVHEEYFYIKTIFPKSKEDKAALIFIDIIERLNKKAVLSGGNELTVYFN